jgi:transcriptional regulator with XRE-family HTH domain
MIHPIYPDFRYQLKKMRFSYLISQEELARLLCLKTRAAICQFENGKSLPSYETLIRIVAKFGISLNWLMLNDTIQYTPSSVFCAECSLEHVLKEIDCNNVFFKWLANYGYDLTALGNNIASDYNFWNITSKLHTRANIVVLINILFIKDIEDFKFFLDHKNDLEAIVKIKKIKIYSKFKTFSDYKFIPLGKLELNRFNNLKDILNNNIIS